MSSENEYFWYFSATVINGCSTTMAGGILAPSGHCCEQTNVRNTLILLLHAWFSLHATTAASTNDWVSLDKAQLRIEERGTGEVVCSRRPGQNGSVTWIDPLHRIVSVDNRSRVYHDEDSGRLTLTEANVTDSGIYMCAFNLTEGCHEEVDGDARRKCNATLDCRVYVMPDYFVEGVAVLTVNGALLLILVACSVRSAISVKRRLRQYGMQKL